MMLADMGAEVLRIDRPQSRFRPLEARFNLLDRNRRAIAVDIKTPQGIDLVRRLAETADALIEGFRPGVMERCKLGPDDLLKANPRLVYGRMTGWGQDGPLAQLPGHDVNYVALTGVLDAIGQVGEPPVLPLNLVGDLGGGGMYLAFGMMCALWEATRSGRGQVVHAAMVDRSASLMTMFHGFLAAGRWNGRGTNVIAGAAPYYGIYATSDGKYVSIGAAEQPFYLELLRLIGLADEALPDRADPHNWPALRERLAAVFRAKSRDEWAALLGQANVCFAPVLDLQEVPQHPHHRARNTYVEVDGIVQPAPAPRFSRTRPPTPSAGVEPGGDLAAALETWGFSTTEIDALRSSSTAS
ncbi:CaiB/BaiF CoA transferase family protein [Variovorax boronicumulans]|uniref:CaiB/BaiF CoA transferase family protein n=1 Tax=Variovorax boronicumulans TaxID=436515 RepID=UPI0027839CC9|nr:CaiB/BaiF CoA-transferase family protein [Variovorax boronicumulans]MDQ0044394.1 alpha-methylacyl-CoA racemase [Variovorax boronicumulans]